MVEKYLKLRRQKIKLIQAKFRNTIVLFFYKHPLGRLDLSSNK